MKGIYALLQKINRFCAEVTGYLIALIVILLVIDTIGVVFGFQVPTLIEMAMFAVIASAYLGLSYTEELRGHVKVDTVLNRFSAKNRRRLNQVWGLLSFLVIGLTAYAAVLKAGEAFVEGEAMAGEVLLPLAPIRTIIAVSLCLYAIQIVSNWLIDLGRESEDE